MHDLNTISAGELEGIRKKLGENEDENHFLLSYLDRLRIKYDYELFEFKGTYILNIRGLIISLSYSPSPDKQLRNVLEQMKSRMVIVPGESSIPLLKDISSCEMKIENLMALKRESFSHMAENNILSSRKEYAALFDFYQSVDEYRNYYTYKDMMSKFKERDSKHFSSAVKADEKIVSALIMNSGLIASVGTLKEYRNKGYASGNIKSAISYYFQMNKAEKTVYLFYNDSRISEAYKRIGFYDICPFLILKRNI